MMQSEMRSVGFGSRVPEVYHIARCASDTFKVSKTFKKSPCVRLSASTLDRHCVAMYDRKSLGIKHLTVRCVNKESMTVECTHWALFSDFMVQEGSLNTELSSWSGCSCDGYGCLIA